MLKILISYTFMDTSFSTKNPKQLFFSASGFKIEVSGGFEPPSPVLQTVA
jgi:hypothetical protein